MLKYDTTDSVSIIIIIISSSSQVNNGISVIIVTRSSSDVQAVATNDPFTEHKYAVPYILA